MPGYSLFFILQLVSQTFLLNFAVRLSFWFIAGIRHCLTSNEYLFSRLKPCIYDLYQKDSGCGKLPGPS